MNSIQFATHKNTQTQYQIVTEWDRAFGEWFIAQSETRRWSQISVLSDENVWALYADRINNALRPLERPFVPIVISAGEESKDFSTLKYLVDQLVEHRVHRRDLLVCFGGGVCCDIGGLLALLYMRGMDYVNLPTSLMAQIDGAIGGKVGANYGLRKNLLGGFYHPLLVLIDPRFLDTLPDDHFRSAFSEAVKVAIICEDDALLELLEQRNDALIERNQAALTELLTACLEGKIALLKDDPYENDLDRALNLGHGVAHAVERLPVMPGQRRPSHGEAVAIGLATAIRYAFRFGLCKLERAERLLGVLVKLGLPVSPGDFDGKQIRDQLSRIPEHRGGQFRLVLPVDSGGVQILPHANQEALVQCLFPIPRLPM